MKSWSIFDNIYKNGNTIIIVTHEEDIANHARRVIRLRDGMTESDNRSVIELRCCAFVHLLIQHKS